MKTSRIIVVVVVATSCLVAAWISPFHYQQEQGLTALDPTLQRKLEIAIVDSFKVHDATLDEVVFQVNEELAHRTELQPLQFVCWTKAQPPSGFHRREKSPSKPVPAASETISLEVANATVNELLRYIALSTPVTVGQQGDKIYLIEADGVCGLMEEETYSFKQPMSATELTSMKEGVGFCEGCSAKLLVGRRIRVRAPRKVLDSCAYYFYPQPPTLYTRIIEWIRNQAGSPFK